MSGVWCVWTAGEWTDGGSRDQDQFSLFLGVERDNPGI